MELTMNTTVTLNNGIKMPMLGYGTALISENLEETTRTICQAIEAGYRHLDTAMIYYNEEAVGEAIRRCGIPREKLFVTTKLWTEDQRRDRQYEAFEESLSRLGLDYVDLYLIHWPVPGKVLPSWKVMERIYREGRARAIGLSNCHEHYIESMLLFIWAFNSFTIIFIMTYGGPAGATTTLPFLIRQTAFKDFNFGKAMALAILVLLIICISLGVFFLIGRGFKALYRRRRYYS